MSTQIKGKTLQVLNFILSSDHPPTVREIQKALNFSSTSTVHYHLSILEKHGLIKRDRRKARGIILPRGEKLIPIPMLGFIYADKPLPGPESTPQEFIELPPSILKNAKAPFALRVVGNSMVDAGIYDGDIVILERVEEVRDGDMVAVWLRGKDATTLKRFFRDENGVTLKPESPFFTEPIRIEGGELENLEVQAKVIMVIRKF